MSLRGVLAGFGIAGATMALAVGVVLHYVTLQVRMSSADLGQYSQAEVDAWSEQLNTAWVFIQHTPWLFAGGLLALVTSVALLAIRGQRAASASSATASREA